MPESAAPSTTLKLDQFLPYRLATTAFLVSEALSQIYGRQHKLSIGEWRVLATLAAHGSMTGKQICRHASMHKTRVSRSVSLLEQRRLISRTRNRDDLRELPLALTAAGRRMYEDLVPRVLAFENKILNSLETSEREALFRALEKIRAVVQ